MQLTFAMRDRSAVEVVLGRKNKRFKSGIKRIVRDTAKEAYAIAYLLSAYRTGRMQRLLKVTYTPAGFGFDLGWSAKDFRAEGVYFYPPRVVLGLGQRPQDNITPAWQAVRPRLEQRIVKFTRDWARSNG